MDHRRPFIDPTLGVTFGNGFENNTVVRDDTLVFAQVSGASLPATFPLFASGLGGPDLLAWRRKRKNGSCYRSRLNRYSRPQRRAIMLWRMCLFVALRVTLGSAVLLPLPGKGDIERTSKSVVRDPFRKSTGRRRAVPISFSLIAIAPSDDHRNPHPDRRLLPRRHHPLDRDRARAPHGLRPR